MGHPIAYCTKCLTLYDYIPEKCRCGKQYAIKYLPEYENMEKDLGGHNEREENNEFM